MALKPRTKPRLRDRLGRSIKENKAAYSLGTFFAAVFVVWPVVKELHPMVMWVNDYFAKKSELEAHDRKDRIEDARGRLETLGNREFMVRWALIDCAAKVEKKTIASTQNQACKDLEAEYDRVKDRREEVRKKLQELRDGK